MKRKVKLLYSLSLNDEVFKQALPEFDGLYYTKNDDEKCQLAAIYFGWLVGVGRWESVKQILEEWV